MFCFYNEKQHVEKKHGKNYLKKFYNIHKNKAEEIR